jgi:sulfite exporter TauE/SafE
MEAFAAAAFAAGLLGGVHCAGMCGGIAAALSGASKGPAWQRIAAFNLGRIGSYAAAGALAGSLGALGRVAGPVHATQMALFVTAQVFLVLLGLYVAGWGGALVKLEAVGGPVWRRIEPLRRHCFPIDSHTKAFGAGAVWGWVPCGLVYGILAFAVATSNALDGALVLAAFGLGTLPALVAAGAAARRIAELRRNPWVRRAAGVAIIAMAVVSLAHLVHAHG